MRKRFGEAYYEAEEGDEAGQEVDGDVMEKKRKAKKPKWDDDIVIKDLVPDFEDEDGERPAFTLSDEEDESVDGGAPLPVADTVPNVGTEEDDDNDDDAPASKQSRQIKKDRAKDKAATKRAARLQRATIESLVDRALPIAEPAMASTTLAPKAQVGGFRYRATSPTRFGLTSRDILFADDARLNEFVGLKKMHSFRDVEKKRRDKKRFSKKARVREWRREVFGREDGPAAVPSLGGDYGKREEKQREVAEEAGGIVDGERKKKRKRSGRKGKEGVLTPINEKHTRAGTPLAIMPPKGSKRTPVKKTPVKKTPAKETQADDDEASASGTPDSTPRTRGRKGKGKGKAPQTDKVEESDAKANTPKKTSVRQNKHQTVEVLVPGDMTDLSTFFSSYEIEARVAAYLGYTDTSDFRRYVLSHHFLKHYLRFAGGDNWAKDIRVKSAFGLIRDRFINGKAPAEYPTDDDTAEKYVSQKTGVGKNKRLAHLLICFVHEVSGTDSPDTIMAVDAEQQTEAVQALKALKPNVFGTHDFPDTGDQPVKLPKFTTAFEEESELEQYNRAFAALKSFGYCVNSQGHWGKRFAAKNDWAASKAISEEHVPTWMQTLPGSADDVLNPDEATHQALAHMPIQLMWLPMNGLALKQHIDAAAAVLKPWPESFREAGEADPRVYNQYQYRDSIRRQFQCVQLGVDLATLNLKIIPSGPVDEDTDVRVIDLMKTDWDEVQNELNSAFRTNQPSANRVEVSFRVSPLDEGASPEDIFETNEPPPQLARFFHIVDGEVEAKDDDVADAEPAGGEAPGDDGGTASIRHEDFLKLTTLGKSKSGKWQPDAKEHFPGRKNHEEYLRHFDGIDVAASDAERHKWQRKVVRSIIQGNKKSPPVLNNRKAVGNGKDKHKAAIAALNESIKVGEFTSMAGGGQEHADAQDPDEQLRYFTMQSAFSGTEAQLGPLLEPCLAVMGMTEQPREPGDAFSKYKCTLIPKLKRTFYPYQVTGAACILLRLLGTIPGPLKHTGKDEIQNALSSLSALQTFGIINADYTGLGKTIETLLALAFIVLFWAEKTPSNGRATSKPHLIAVPASAVSTWAREIGDHWLMVFELAVSYDSDVLDDHLKDRVIDSSTMKALPDDRSGLALSNDKDYDFSYLFDETSAKNHRTVVLTSHDTHAERFVQRCKVDIPPVSFDPPKFRRGTGTEIYAKAGWVEEHYESKMARRFLTSTWDEVHMIKNPATRNWAGAFLMKAKYHILISATPMQNNAGDIIGSLMLLWPTAKAFITSNEICTSFNTNVKSDFRKAFEALESSDATDERRLCLMNPKRVAGLLRTENPMLIQKYFHLVEDLIVIRRSPNSILKVNDDGDTIDLASMMKPHTIKTVQLQREKEQATMYQFFHREAAERYVKDIRGGQEDDAQPKPKSSASRVPIHQQRNAFVYPVVPLRDLDIANASTTAARFNRTLTKAKRSTLVRQMQQWRMEGIDGIRFVKAVRHAADRALDTRADYVKLLAESSPMLVEILREYDLRVLTNGEKMLLIENVPLIAWFWEIACRLLLIPIATMHADLNQRSRTELADLFNAPGGLMMLTIMHDVGGQSINLQNQCHTVLVLHPGISMAKLLQSIGRVIRVDQKSPVDVLYYFVKNSHSAWRIYRQSSKIMVELATRAYDPAVRDLLVWLLQEHQRECEEAHDSDEGKLVLDYMKQWGMEIGEAPLEGLAGTFDDSAQNETLSETAPAALPSAGDGKRVRRAPERYSAWNYMGPNGTQIEDPQKRKAMAAKAAKSYFRGDDGSGGDLDPAAQSEDEDFDGRGEEASEASGDEEAYDVHLRQMRERDLKEVDFTDEVEDLMAKVKYPRGHQYVDSDLDDAITLRRALNLLYKARMGLPFLIESKSIHINYTHLPAAVAAKVKKSADSNQRDSKLIAERFGKLVAKSKSTAPVGQKIKKVLVSSAKGLALSGTELVADIEDETQLYEQSLIYQAFKEYKTRSSGTIRRDVAEKFCLDHGLDPEQADAVLNDDILLREAAVNEPLGDADDVFTLDLVLNKFENMSEAALKELLRLEGQESVDSDEDAEDLEEEDEKGARSALLRATRAAAATEEAEDISSSSSSLSSSSSSSDEDKEDKPTATSKESRVRIQQPKSKRADSEGSAPEVTDDEHGETGDEDHSIRSRKKRRLTMEEPGDTDDTPLDGDGVSSNERSGGGAEEEDVEMVDTSGPAAADEQAATTTSERADGGQAMGSTETSGGGGSDASSGLSEAISFDPGLEQV
ncbi:Kinetochore protein Spc24 [Teratosphaeriaceae sp. CCFEE 6253]|nr:Kinetochore protein Spc24 [Teratosphaeriaceae sp. CCFEE 6253]